MSEIETNGHWQAGYDEGYAAGWDAQKTIQSARIAALEAQLATREQDAAVGIHLSTLAGYKYVEIKLLEFDGLIAKEEWLVVLATYEEPTRADMYYGDTLESTLAAAGLIEKGIECIQ